MSDLISPGPSGPPPKQMSDLFAGTRYTTVRPLAAGGMGEVFLVRHAELQREFVIKVLHQRFAADAQLLDRVRVEAQTMARLAHRHIVAVVDYGATRDERPFIVMERLIGRTLAAELSEHGALPPEEAVDYVLQLLAALEATHAAGIVHRDIKPENLFLTEDAEGRTVLQLLDFGIARVLPGFADAAPVPLLVPTDTGLVVGTPRFVSPEGALGKKVDARADVYAAGLMLYLLLAGRGPFDHLHSEAQILAAHVNLEAVAPSAVAGHLPNQEWPEVLDEIVLCALCKNPVNRFQSATEFREVLQGLVDAVHASIPPEAENKAREDLGSHQFSVREVEADSQAEAHWFAQAPLSDGTAAPIEPSVEPAEAEPTSSFGQFMLTPLSAASGLQWLFFFAVIAVTAIVVAQLASRVLRYWP